MELPLSYGSNSLLLIMDQLTKFVYLLFYAFGPDHPFGVVGMANLLVHHIVCKYGVIPSIVYEQNGKFTVDLS